MEGKVITFQRTAQGQTVWTVEEDAVLTHARSTTTVCISRNPNDTSTNFQTPTANIIAWDKLCGTTSTVQLELNGIEVKKGEVIYVNLGGAGSAQLNLVTFPS